MPPAHRAPDAFGIQYHELRPTLLPATNLPALQGDKLDASVKAAYTTGDKKYSGDVTVDPSGKVAINTSIHNVGPGVKVSVPGIEFQPAGNVVVSIRKRPGFNLCPSTSVVWNASSVPYPCSR